MRSIDDLELPDVLVCLPSFKFFSWFLLIKLMTCHSLISYAGLPHI